MGGDSRYWPRLNRSLRSNARREHHASRVLLIVSSAIGASPDAYVREGPMVSLGREPALGFRHVGAATRQDAAAAGFEHGRVVDGDEVGRLGHQSDAEARRQ